MENIENIKDDEIDLIDLFIVLLKHRKLILGTTLAVLLILGAGYFIYPPYQYKKAVDSQLYEVNMEIKLNPMSESFTTDYDPKKDFSNSSILLSSLQKAGYKELGYGESEMVDISSNADKQKALNIVRQYLIKNQTLNGDPLDEETRILKITNTNTNANIHITFKDKNSDMALAFLMALIENVNEKILEDIIPKLDLIVSNYNSVLSGDMPNDVIKEILVKDNEEYQLAVAILQGNFNFFKLVGEPSIFKAQLSIEKFKGSYKKTAVIVLFAVFFLTIFLAFILQFLEQIKSNDESMAKIREALKKK